MTTHLRPSHLAHIAALATRLGTELARPCTCGRTGCTIGDHVLRALRDGQIGPPAQDLQPATSGGGTNDGLATAFIDDREDRARVEFTTAALQLQRQAETLLIICDNWAPDRKLGDDTASDDQWCAWHLSTIGTCEPRYSGDQCRWCYDFRRQHDMMPTQEILRARHAGQRITATMVADVKRAQKHKRTKKRRKARR